MGVIVDREEKTQMHWHEGNQACKGKGWFSFSFDIGDDAHIIHELIGAEDGKSQLLKVFVEPIGLLTIYHGIPYRDWNTGRFGKNIIISKIRGM